MIIDNQQFYGRSLLRTPIYWIDLRWMGEWMNIRDVILIKALWQLD